MINSEKITQILKDRRLLLGILICFLTGFFFTACRDEKEEVPGFRITGECPYDLCVMIVVDQLGMDHIRRFERGWTRGLAELTRNGSFFRGAEVDHGITYTAPGHAVLGTGRHPSHHGVIGNKWYSRELADTVGAVKDETTRGVGYDDYGKGSNSPFLMEGITFSEIFHSAFPKSLYVSLGMKGYAAVCIGGKDADHVYWFDEDQDGYFVTSSYYQDALPGWVDAFNRLRYHEKFRTVPWQRPDGEPLPEARVRQDFFRFEGGDGFLSLYPHVFRQGMRGDPGDFAAWFLQTPWSDKMLLDFALASVEGLQLGNRGTPDMLCICLAANDYIGHNFGPRSLEAWDHLQHLDRYLGEFLADLNQKVDPERTLIILTSDHGVQPIPEYLREKNEEAIRLGDNYKNDIALIEKKLNRRFGEDLWFEMITRNTIYLNYEALARKNVRRSDVEDIVIGELSQLSWAGGVYGRTRLESADGVRDGEAGLVRNGFHPGRSGDILFSLKESFIVGNIMDPAANHGSPYLPDRRVPLVFYDPPRIKPARHGDTPARLVDVVPTLLRLLKVEMPYELDGQPLPVGE